MTFREEVAKLRTTRPRGPFPTLAWAWPTGGRDLLLRAATLPDLNRAAEIYRQWEASTDFDDVDWAHMRLLVGISNRLPDSLVAAKDRARLRGIERKLWSECVMALRTAEPALGALARAGIDVMVFKGAVRTVLDFANLRGRYASELDLLVRPDDFVRAWDAIVSEGWQYVMGYRPPLDRIIGANLSKAKAGELDLHKYPYHQLIHSDAHPTALWGRAVRATFLGHPVFVPSPTDRLVMAIAHGGIGGHEQSDWLVDCAVLIREGEVDWGLFLRLLHERGIEGYAAVAVGYLVGPLEVPVPQDVLAALRAFGWRHPWRMTGALLQSRPKREHSIPTAIARGFARAGRMYKKREMIKSIERRRKLEQAAEVAREGQ